MFKFCFSVLRIFLIACVIYTTSLTSHPSEYLSLGLKWQGGDATTHKGDDNQQLSGLDIKQQIDTLLRSDTPHPFSGTVLITRRKQVLYRNQNTSLTSDSQFIIGSISKQMTAAIALREIDRGRLQLDTPIKTYLPNLPETWGNGVTVKQLLNHTSGIERLDAPLRHPPGKRFFYTNIEYDLLGKIVEKTSEKSFAALAQSMFQSCGMDKTKVPPSGTITALRKLLPKLVRGYTEQPDGTLITEDSNRDATTNPSGGIISTAQDLQRWNTCLHTGQLLKPLTYRDMITPDPSAKRDHRWGILGYGYGIQVSHQGGLLELSHSGYVPGYISTLIYYPQQQISVVILENTAWLANDISRVFSVHDRLRHIIRNNIAVLNDLQTPRNPVTPAKPGF